VAAAVPLERLLVETDCPYLTPVPYRGRRNEPAYVQYVAESVAQARGMAEGELARATADNARRLFGIR
jgi:TatD DNase family protein